MLEAFTKNAARNGIGDVQAVSEVLKSIGLSDKVEKSLAGAGVIKQKTTERILKTLSNLLESDLRVPDNQAQTKSASKIGGR